MADPRQRVKYRHIDVIRVAFKYDASISYDNTKKGGSTSTGLAVTLTANDTVGLVADGQLVVGRLDMVRADGICEVQVCGVAIFLPGTAATVTAGSRIVGALLVAAKGYVRQQAVAVLAEVAIGRGYILTNADIDNIQGVQITNGVTVYLT